ncbi:MAG TPA: ATP-binding protein [Acidimicrobiia bacterium]
MRAELGARFDDVAIVVSELVSNSVRHSRDDLTLTVITGEDSIRIEVMDWGPGFSRDAPRGDGMGLNIVEKVASDWGVTLDGICTVWVEISRDV